MITSLKVKTLLTRNNVSVKVINESLQTLHIFFKNQGKLIMF